MRSVTVLLLFALFALSAPACTLLTRFDEGKLDEDTFESCRDGVDNDGDGLPDCDDFGCSAFSFCDELTAERCADGQDNDRDRLVDCRDPGCAALPGICVEQTLAACSDGTDNDDDGLIDCGDPNCLAVEVCQERSSAACADNRDNDGDGLTDCSDFDCYAQPACCDLAAPSFTGDDFAGSTACTIEQCSAGSCCTGEYELCSPFDSTRWIAWGLPRARQASGAFVANEPCGCEPSGIVSIEPVRLRSGLTLRFTLDNRRSSGPPDPICGGVTTATTFIDDRIQCTARVSPGLLFGICIETASPDVTRVTLVIDGQAQRTAELTGRALVEGTIAIAEGAVTLSAGSLSHEVPAGSPSLDTGYVVVQGQGVGGRVDSVVVADPSMGASRCPAPSAWYRHLARGQPVIGTADGVTSAHAPTVARRDDGSYLMLFSGEGPGGTGIYSASSSGGVSWEVSSEPVLPESADDLSFGDRQGSPSLLWRQDRFEVWYSREDEAGTLTQRTIAHAISWDGRHWKPSPGAAGHPYVLGPGDALTWDSRAVSSPSVLVMPDGTLRMWYVGTDREVGGQRSIGTAWSSDGTSWVRERERPILEPIPEAGELAYDDPAVLYDAAADRFQIWYTLLSLDSVPRIAHAASKDGLSWIRWPEGPVFAPGTLGTFDARGVEAPAVLLRHNGWIRLWYVGTAQQGVAQIGYAENRGDF